VTEGDNLRGPIIDLHVHSTASDGELAPEAVVARAAAAGLAAIALTDHDTLGGVPAAIAAGERLGVRVVGGCEFSVAAPWGEMHLLGYFLSPGTKVLEDFLIECRADRSRRGRAMVDRLHRLGIPVSHEDVMAEAEGGAVGRPHVARALVRRGQVANVHGLPRDVLARCVVRDGLAHDALFNPFWHHWIPQGPRVVTQS